jgi:hypothetical protein
VIANPRRAGREQAHAQVRSKRRREGDEGIEACNGVTPLNSRDVCLIHPGRRRQRGLADCELLPQLRELRADGCSEALLSAPDLATPQGLAVGGDSCRSHD